MRYITVNHLEKTFIVRKKREKGRLLREKTQLHALNDVSFTIDRGELVGYIGPNGAGKSTTVKILSGILTPDGGEASVDGLVPWQERKKHVQRIGVVFGQRMQLWWDVPILDSFSLLRDIYRVPQAQYRQRLDELVEALELQALLRTPLRLMSLGQRMRSELCASLLHSPELLFLDEPTIAQDWKGRQIIGGIIRSLSERGKLVIAILHDMDFVAENFERVIIMAHGQVLADGTAKEVFAQEEALKKARLQKPYVMQLCEALGYEKSYLTVEELLKDQVS